MTERERHLRLLLIKRLNHFESRLREVIEHYPETIELISLAWLDGAVQTSEDLETWHIIIKILKEPYEEMICTGLDLLKAESPKASSQSS